MTFPINFIGNLLAIEPEPIDSSIRLPDWKRSLKGRVLATGPDCREELLGKTVYFGAAKGMDSVISGQSVRLLKEDDLDFVYEDELTTRVVEQYNINDDPLPCRCTVNLPCAHHMMIGYEA